MVLRFKTTENPDSFPAGKDVTADGDTVVDDTMPSTAVLVRASWTIPNSKASNGIS